MISSTGKVWSDHVRRVLKPETDKDGYQRVVLCSGSTKQRALVHRLVATEFLGPAPVGKEIVAHKNGVPDDNRPDNVYWADYTDNARDRAAHGRNNQGSGHHFAKLSENDIPGIRARIRSGEPHVAIANDYGVSPGMVWHIQQGMAWKHVA